MSDYFKQIEGTEPIPDDVYIDGEPIGFIKRLSSAFKEVVIIPISDCHYGNYLFSEHHFARTVKAIKDEPNVFTILNGDLCESVTKTSRGDIYKQVGSPPEQRDWMIEHLEPIKDKILGVTTGNHEWRIYNDTHQDLCAEIAKALGVPHRATGILIRLIFGSNINGEPYKYDIYATHGWGGARTAAAKAVKLERTSYQVHADVYLMSHDHVVNVAPIVYLMPKNEPFILEDKKHRNLELLKFKAHRKMLVKTNAYLKWGGYSEMGGYPPVDLETPIIKLSGEGKPKVRVEI